MSDPEFSRDTMNSVNWINKYWIRCGTCGKNRKECIAQVKVLGLPAVEMVKEYKQHLLMQTVAKFLHIHPTVCQFFKDNRKMQLSHFSG